MDVRQLEYFQAAANLQSMTKAAGQLCVAQPSISIAIRKLEAELGVQLFDRSQKQLQLTSEGQVFSKRTKDILARLHDSKVEMADYHALRRGSIQMGITPITGAFSFPDIFARFQARYPDIELSVVEEGSLGIKQRLECGELDVAFMIAFRVNPCLAVVPVLSGQFLVCMPPAHKLSNQSVISIEQLAGEKFILFKEDTYSRKLVLAECRRHGIRPHIVFSSSQMETILGLIEHGAGISFLPDAIAEKQAGIISRPLAEPLLLHTCLAWHKERYLSRAARAFIEFVTNKYVF